jgi:BirA family biotin operon repressor/biotin-[acetyl-CoA-carboxylase] ligase
MKVIKLDAIDSTNDFLKGLSSRQELENFTIVSANTQSKGKGQMGAVWVSEAGKNLTMSILIKEFISDINQMFDLNTVVSVSVIEVLELLNIPDLSIKWPNDIMSYNKKIGGILIENSIKSDGSINSVVGLGLNVNQTNFDNLPRASSLAVICDTNFNRDELLESIKNKIVGNISIWRISPSHFNSRYRNYLFKVGVPMPFEDQSGIKFMGIIQGVSAAGKVEIMLEDDAIAAFDIKEVQMLF